MGRSERLTHWDEEMRCYLIREDYQDASFWDLVNLLGDSEDKVQELERILEDW